MARPPNAVVFVAPELRTMGNSSRTIAKIVGTKMGVKISHMTVQHLLARAV